MTTQHYQHYQMLSPQFYCYPTKITGKIVSLKIATNLLYLFFSNPTTLSLLTEKTKLIRTVIV